MKTVQAIGASIGVGLCFFYLGCGSIPIVAAGVPSIEAILPAPLVAGAQGATLKIVGENFDTGSKVLWNGSELSTTVVDSNTLSSPVESANLAVPGVVQLAVKNTLSGQTSPAFKVAVNAGASSNTVTVTTPSLPTGTVQSPYSVSFTATGGTYPYTWSLGSGSKLPAGISLDTAGTLAGTPTAAGSYSFSVVASDASHSQSKSTSYTIVIQALPLSIANSALANVTVGSSYSQTLSATGGSPSYRWSISSGSLPAGLSLNTAKGIISGTPTASGAYSFVVAVKDSSSPAETAAKPLSISVAAAAAAPLQVSTVSIPAGTSGQVYSTNLAATGGKAPYSWSLTSGSLPSGISLSATGVVSGTTSVTGAFPFTASVSDTSGQTTSVSLSLAISATPLKVATSSLPGATKGSSYSQVLQANGGTPGYRWSISAGSLPPGLTLDQTTGAISGTPTTTTASTFTAMATDSTNPTQTATAPLSISVVASPLAVSTPSLPSLSVGVAYSQQLQATGGTTPYTWSLASGTLPPGLSLSSGGLISGSISSASSSYTYSFSVKAQDASNPVQTASAQASIAVAAAATPLSITSSALPSGTANSAYSTTLQAAGGTPGYTWSYSGSLPAGLTLGAATGTISGTPTTSGTSNLTLTVSDNSNPSQSQSVNASITIAAAAQTASGPGTTWYVRPDGGSRYSSNVGNGQCDGKADLPYPGSGTNQHCAFSDYRMLFQDGSYNASLSFPSWGWIISGGDTVIIRGSIASGVSYRVGWPNSTSCFNDARTQCWGVVGNQYMAPPPPPSGTASQHTRILGENYQACTAPSARTQIHGGWGTGVVMPLNGSSYVDVACIDITDFSGCGRNNDSVACQTNGAVLQDYADDGISINNTSTHITLTDVRLHGLSGAGIIGAPGDGFVATNIAILGNANAGWNADDGSGTTGVGSTLVQNFEISWNGCVEEYPIVDTVPYISCRDQSTGGYGDGFGTTTADSPAPGWQLHFDNGVVSYNTQDGLDALHIGGTGSSISETRILAYGNEGEQLKVGGAIANIQNSVIVGNCEALTSGVAIPGRPAQTQDNLASPCRAGNVAVFVTTSPGYTTYFQNNTIYSAGNIGLEVEYAYPSNMGNTNLFSYENNIFVGFPNSGSGRNPTPIYSTSDLTMLVNPGSTWSHNLYYGYRENWACPAAGEVAAICGDPGLKDETYHIVGYGNMSPTSTTSRVIGAGLSLPTLGIDYLGVARGTPPTVGAYELPSTP